MSDPAHEAAHAHPNYVKIWAILVGLLVLSVLGPMLGIQAVTLITAFGIAVVKAYLVAKNFMHINVEKRFVPYAVVTVLVFMLLFFAGTAPDVMKKEGTQWEKPAWKAHPDGIAGGGGHGSAH
jgi:caa(3)-type oxidase subunit IV